MAEVIGLAPGSLAGLEHLERDLAFPLEEYKDRLRRLRGLMADAKIDLLWITTPEAAAWLHGLVCSWYKGNSPMRYPQLYGTAVHVDSDESIFFDPPSEAPGLAKNSVSTDNRFFTSREADDNLTFIKNELAAKGWLNGRVALEFTARVERCPGAAMPMPTDAGTPTGPAVERTIGYRAATYTQRGNWVFRCDANYAYTARGDHASEDCTGGYAPDGTLRGTATFRFTNVAAATYDVLIGSRHSSNRNDMRALFTVNGEANRIDQRTGDGALAIVTDVWGRRALSGTVTVVLDATRNSGSDSVSFVTLRPVR